MPEQNKLQGMIGLAKRAGKVVAGTPMVCEAVRKKKAMLVLIADDATENAKKKVQNCCDYYHIPYHKTSFSTADLAHMIGKSSVIAAIAVADSSFAGAIGAFFPLDAKESQKKHQEV
jgi:ribosomal protein L7Ae-like RNA K-turn-binding protein